MTAKEANTTQTTNVFLQSDESRRVWREVTGLQLNTDQTSAASGEAAWTRGSAWIRGEAFPLRRAGTEASHLLLREEEVDPLRDGLASLG